MVDEQTDWGCVGLPEGAASLRNLCATSDTHGAQRLRGVDDGPSDVGPCGVDDVPNDSARSGAETGVEDCPQV